MMDADLLHYAEKLQRIQKSMAAESLSARKDQYTRRKVLLALDHLLTAESLLKDAAQDG